MHIAMKIFQILLFALSTVSCIHCSRENEDSNAAYHIEFEDKSPNGGYGYKVQVSGKSKYQETWKKDRQNIQTETPTVTESSYLQNNYAAAAVTESVIKPNDNSFASNYLTQNQYLNNPAVGTTENSIEHIQQETNNNPSSSSYRSKHTNKNSYSSSQRQINDIPPSSYQNEQINENPFSSLNNFGSSQQMKNIPNSSYHSDQITENPYYSLNSFGSTQQQANNILSSNYQSDKISKNPYSTLNNFGSTQQQINGIPSSSYQTEQISKNPYTSLNSFSSYSQQSYKPESSAQNNFSPQIDESNGQDWQVSSKSRFIPSPTVPSKSSLQIVDYNHFGFTNEPQVFVESTAGKLHQNQFTNQNELNSQINLPTEADLPNKYLQNSNIFKQNSFQTPSTSKYVNIPTTSDEYYQPSIQSKETNNFKTLAQTSQYASQVPDISLPHSIESQLSQLTTNINDNSAKYSVQYAAPLSQYDSNDAVSYSITQNPSNSKVQYYAPLSTTHLGNQKFYQHNNSKENAVYKTIASTIKYAPQYQSESALYSAPLQKPISNVENPYKQYIPGSQYSEIPQVSLTNSDYSQGTVQSQNIEYKPSTLASNYPNEISLLPASGLDSQGIKYDQNSLSLQGNPSVYLPSNYNQLLQQYPVQVSSVAAPVSLNSYQQISPSLQLKHSPQLFIDYNQFLQASNQYTNVPAVNSPLKNIQFQNLYTAQQPITSKNVVKYQYKQELSSPKTQSGIIPNNAVNPSNSQYTYLSSDNPSELAYTYDSLGYDQQAVSGLGTAGNGIPISPYGIYGKDNSQVLYVPGLVYAQGYQGVSSRSLPNLNGYGTTGSYGNVGGPHTVNPYKISRRSTGKHENGKNVNDEKQTG